MPEELGSAEAQPVMFRPRTCSTPRSFQLRRRPFQRGALPMESPFSRMPMLKHQWEIGSWGGGGSALSSVPADSCPASAAASSCQGASAPEAASSAASAVVSAGDSPAAAPSSAAPSSALSPSAPAC